MATAPASTFAPEISKALSSISASPAVLSLLTQLHARALAEPPLVSTDVLPHRDKPAGQDDPQTSRDRSEALRDRARDLLVALDPDKCALVYLLLRATGARHVVEAGTSFGVSTVYLALAVGQNVLAAGGGSGKVIATENEPTKAAAARENWRLAGEEEVARWIELREGNLVETLSRDMPSPVEFLLLDIWTPLALPTLRLVEPHLKKGALIAIDNIDAARQGYESLLSYVNRVDSGFKHTVAPYSGGLQLLVYLGQQ